jgi:hypothetical protein
METTFPDRVVEVHSSQSAASTSFILTDLLVVFRVTACGRYHQSLVRVIQEPMY